MINPDSYRRIATEYLLALTGNTAEEVGNLSDYLDDTFGKDGWTDDDCNQIGLLHDSALVTVTWPEDYIHWVARCRCGTPVAVSRVSDHPTYEQARAELVGWDWGYGLEQVTHKQWQSESKFLGRHRRDCPAELVAKANGGGE